MKRKTSDTPKIPSEKASPKIAETKGILALAPTPAHLTPFQELIEEWLDYCKAGGLSKETLRDYRSFIYKFNW